MANHTARLSCHHTACRCMPVHTLQSHGPEGLAVCGQPLAAGSVAPVSLTAVLAALAVRDPGLAAAFKVRLECPLSGMRVCGMRALQRMATMLIFLGTVSMHVWLRVFGASHGTHELHVGALHCCAGRTSG